MTPGAELPAANNRNVLALQVAGIVGAATADPDLCATATGIWLQLELLPTWCRCVTRTD